MTDKVGVVPVAFDTRSRIRRSYAAVMPTPRSQASFPDSATECRIKSVPKRTREPGARAREKRGVGLCSAYASSNVKASRLSNAWPMCGSAVVETIPAGASSPSLVNLATRAPARISLTPESQSLDA